MFLKVLIAFHAAAALVSMSQAVPSDIPESPLASPCPETFTYGTIDKPGYWTGNLILRPDHDISGVWVRLIFDKEVEKVTLNSEEFIIKLSEDSKMVKLQSPDMLLKADNPKLLEVTVNYKGSAVPSLQEYRLNARTICPQKNHNRHDVFLGDANADYFLSSIQHKPESPNIPFECGVSYPSNQYPWQASIHLHFAKEKRYACEALLISSEYLLTSAHCVTFINDTEIIPRAFVKVHLGSDKESKDQHYIREIFVHPGYRAGSIIDDIAVIKLLDYVDVNKVYRPLCLDNENADIDKLVITGFQIGKDGVVGNLLESNVLRIDNKECIKLTPYLKEVLDNDNYCVSYKSDDKNCVGDSGSGLLAFKNNKATLKGLVVLGPKLQNKEVCDAKTNVVILDIADYLPWIYNIVF
ncbi:vitamin K-dependent protein C [Diabrotica virgifera virgifera]|uniref:Peptidase S1 domain-containing protein n=1 Tax=Diabrotica virgifera virgifera TaxID=50390 RepID=A0ABM5IUF1_DIAVI|nr:vitamin K-dependent protein C [Diabrotica virgifera virgifera]